MVELSLPCFSYSLLNRPDDVHSLPSRVSNGTMVPGLHTRAEGASPFQTFCCRVPRRCLAVQAHMMLCLFLREQLCPRRQILALFVRVAAWRQEMGCFAKRCL